MISLTHTISVISQYDINVENFRIISINNDNHRNKNSINIMRNLKERNFNGNRATENSTDENIYLVDQINFEKTVNSNYKKEKNDQKLKAIIEINDKKENLFFNLLKESTRSYVHLLCVVGIESTQSLGDLHLVDKIEHSRKKDFGKKKSLYYTNIYFLILHYIIIRFIITSSPYQFLY